MLTSLTKEAAEKKLLTMTAIFRLKLNPAFRIIHCIKLLNFKPAPQGSYSYTDANGELVEVKYTAGKDGFRILNENKPEQPRATGSNKQSNLDWIQSIKARPSQILQLT